jgi:hypothetical protein
VSSYTVVDLVEAIAAGDAKRVEVVASAFGLRVPPRGTGTDEPALPIAAKTGPDDFYLAGLLGACLRSRTSGISPFREYLEGPEVIIELFQRFGRRLGELEEAGERTVFRAALDQLTLTVATRLWHFDDGATF